MLGIFQDTEAELYPARAPDVIACQSALQAARALAEPAQKAWAAYVAAHADETPSVPFRRQKQQLYEAVADTSEAVEVAQAALTHALEAATVTATALWDARIREQFLDDVPAIEAFIVILEKHEQLVTEAAEAGVSHALHVPRVFVTAGELRTRLAYARTQLGIEK